ncbi:MAG TPA: MFS transporter [Gemmatimonadaceae bacterium]|jgi:DHA2 family methylenomycin A resistance protein-like MFS transporter|nr:MFS transporter [Gemmatimonadaceae bacterium]
MTTQAIAIGRERPYGLYAICFGFFLVLFDTTALNVAIASMHRELGGTMSGLQWIVNAYTIVFASLVLTCGALGDRYGAKRLYQLGLGLFTLMSLCCALSPGVGFLIVARMFQGFGAAMMLPASLALLSHAYPDPLARARAVSFWASIVSLGFAAGPALGGVFTSYFGWRSIFLLNVPTGIVALLMVRAFIEETNVTEARTLDWIGQLSVSLVLWALSYALIEAGNAGWSAPRVLAAFLAAIVLSAVCALSERRSASPVFPGALFSRPAFVACVGAGIGLNISAYGILFVESIYLQSVRHMSALATGAMIVPLTLLPTVTTRMIDRYRADMHFKPRLVTGQILGLSGAAIMALSVWIPANAVILIGFGLLGVALGYVTPAMTTGVLTSAPAGMAGLASGILNAGRQVGGAIGVALMGTLVQMHHDRGMVVSFGVTLALFGVIAVWARRAIPEP